MSSAQQSMQVRLASPPKFKKGYVYDTWESEFCSFIERVNPDLLRMFTEEGYSGLPSKEDAEKMALGQQINGGTEQETFFKAQIKLNN